MTTKLILDLHDLFSKVEQNEITCDDAVKNFCMMNEGYVYIPKWRISKRDKIVNALKKGLSVNQIISKYKVCKRYAYYIKRQVQ